MTNEPVVLLRGDEFSLLYKARPGFAVKKVAKSRILRRRIKALRRAGWTVMPQTSGASTNRAARQIKIASSKAVVVLGFVRSLSHESGHAGYTPPPEVPKTPGITKAQFIGLNVQRHLVDEAEATLFNAQVREELLRKGHGDIGISGANAAQYQAIYDDYAATRITRQQAIDQIADLYRTEVGSVSGERYDIKWENFYEKKWDTPSRSH